MPTIEQIHSRILVLPDRPPLMIARDLAEFYGVKTEQVGQAVHRNPDRFPPDFAFRLTREETTSQNVMSSPPQGGGHLPLVFTEAGALALSGVLKTRRAAEVSVLVHRAFVALARAPQSAPAPAATSVAGMLMVAAEEYIGLLKARIAALEAEVTPRRRRRGVLPLTSAELETIRRLRREGLSYSAIARQVGRATSTVSMIAREVHHG